MLRRRRESGSGFGPSESAEGSSTGASLLTEPFVADLGNPRVIATADALVRDDAAAVGAAYDSSPDWNERLAIVETMVSTEARRVVVDRWASTQPTHPSVAVAVGASAIQRAWAARGSGRASTVTNDGAQIFTSQLRAGELHLEATLRLDPQSPLPWCFLLMSGRGLSISRHELAFRFEHCWARSPDLLAACQQYLQGLCGKWGGSDDLMQAFVQNVVSGAAVGSALHSLRVDEQVELTFSSDHDFDHVFTHNAAVIDAAAANSATSGHLDDAPERVASLVARNKFALAFLLSGRREAADTQFAHIAGRYTEEPWKMFGSDLAESAARQRELAAQRASA